MLTVASCGHFIVGESIVGVLIGFVCGAGVAALWLSVSGGCRLRKQ